MDTVISICGVAKQYRTGKIGAGYLYREIEYTVRRLLFSLGVKKTIYSEQNCITALDNITLSVGSGECVGIIGPNGSGKSTLLKLLCGVTLPSKGTIEIRGKTASLLDIGIGFENDLPARDNIFLNGAVLGMNRKEITDRFGDILSFSGVGRFIDTPLKRFSAGMYIRLAFSIAIHCFADILLIDEILASADRFFIGKCISKLKELSASGTTIIIVSHNLQIIRALCTRTVFLSDGKTVADGETEKVLGLYCGRNYLRSIHPTSDNKTC